MLRRIYRCVLRLHPPGFRRRFGDEILSIFDHSKGKLSAFRLLIDGLFSLVRQWTLRPEFWNESVSAPAQQAALDGVPSFCTLTPFRPRAAAVIPGLILTMAVFSLTCVAIKYSWIRVLHVHIPEVQFEAPQWIPPNARPADLSDRTTAPLQDQVIAPNLPNTHAQTDQVAASKPATPSAVAARAPNKGAVQSSVSAQLKARQSNGNEIARTSAEPEPQAAAGESLTTGEPAAFAEDAQLMPRPGTA